MNSLRQNKAKSFLPLEIDSAVLEKKIRSDWENSKEVGGFIEFTKAEDSKILRQKLAKFDANRSEQVEGGVKSFHNQRFELIMNNLSGAEFFHDNKGKIKITCSTLNYDCTIEEFRNYMKVEEVIASGIKEVEKNEVEDNYSEVSSIFSEYEENDEQKPDNQEEGHESLELKAKNKELAAESETISELEYNEEEVRFLAGQITDQQKKEEIAQQIEAKLLKKNNKVEFEKKAKEIKQEIKNAENNSNLHSRQAFKHAKNKSEALLRELESITNENINTTSDSHKFG
ncbi:17941_t:CDS:2 [Funneliformis geosporum]|nr:17941_t:CDS:2 [Funneliformis geosporum]